ncbi:hypothetical protein AAVH_22373 [Aphelenchoides avenae]|nr:hypothetical protein AAVH_22373 [Aphelenchus avenae]
MTAPADVEPPAKRLKVAARESARKPTAKSVENAIAKPTKQNASDKRSSLKERDDYSEHYQVCGGRYYCAYNTTCMKDFAHPINCRAHIASKHLKHSFRCLVCGYQKPLKQNVYRHLDDHEEVAQTENGAYIEKIKPPVNEEE